MRFPLLLAATGFLLVTAAIAVAGLRRGEARETEQPPPPPSSVTTTFNFFGLPNLAYVCWGGAAADTTFVDIRLIIVSGEVKRDDVRYGVPESDCGGSRGASVYTWHAGLHHFAVRACNNAGCSEWADAGVEERYWFEMPCSDPSGAACARPR